MADERTTCPAPCDKGEKIIARFTTNGIDPARRTMDLTPYQGDGVAPAKWKWELREEGDNTFINGESVNCDGKLVNLQSSFTSGYSYDGYVVLKAYL